ncbi:hypothetical protein BDW42DRAFT_160853 [Aspergillus taichungensis]|uniref:Uncharacterized protein n=1 Tax=Aspergillus taichungensis TaxID=482145 RepID=A0A2J5I5S7_9EURO|nr:hypothetical protein BDW42DRAFT_160853 [Aspergillus taichungensis]
MCNTIRAQLSDFIFSLTPSNRQTSSGSKTTVNYTTPVPKMGNHVTYNHLTCGWWGKIAGVGEYFTCPGCGEELKKEQNLASTEGIDVSELVKYDCKANGRPIPQGKYVTYAHLMCGWWGNILGVGEYFTCPGCEAELKGNQNVANPEDIEIERLAYFMSDQDGKLTVVASAS